ncbi:Mu transposase C-terminal domain-containing protein [Streptomyces sp. NTH33]|uniref:Mu transposase C-terminal domain-containing protein n=1 Tax=Streptomyces sp. NTH33 TaxID=1735453 RepID=UPI0026C94B9E|nr:Mu transposase C-terminal domain-containing protein [Streptomyces sp. NTH33]
MAKARSRKRWVRWQRCSRSSSRVTPADRWTAGAGAWRTDRCGPCPNQGLLDEWIVIWQNRPHDALRDPDSPKRAFTPNEKYATLLESCGYVPAPFSGEDYVELLPERWQAINSYGIRINHRTYDDAELTPLRRQHSGVAEKKGLWEIHYDPYDVPRVWVRDRRSEPARWITVFWKHLHRVGVPFGEMAWDHAREQVPEGPCDEAVPARRRTDPGHCLRPAGPRSAHRRSSSGRSGGHRVGEGHPAGPV